MGELDRASHPLRLVFFTRSLRNSFIEAWLMSLQLAGVRCVVLVDGSVGHPDPSFVETFDWPVFRDDEAGWRQHVEHELGGEPQVLFYWWGLDLLEERQPIDTWGGAVVSLCVDTFPNASRYVSEIREKVRARRRLGLVDSLVVQSPRMKASVCSAFSLEPSAVSVVENPFPPGAQVAQPAGRGSVRTRASARPTLCFVGRSDLLFADSRSMRKDAVGPRLTQYLTSGFDVFVQEPEDHVTADTLAGAGFTLYPRHDRRAITDGRFSAFLDGFDAQYVSYNVWNGTIRRRVANGLSTRFAVGLCSSTPMVLPPFKTFADDLFEGSPGPLSDTNPDQVLEDCERRADAFRAWWGKNRERWDAQRSVTLLTENWKVMRG